MRRKLLLITQAYPPTGGGGVQRIVKFSRYLSEAEWLVTVVTTCHRTDGWIDSSRLAEVEDIQVIRVGNVSVQRSILQRVLGRLMPVDPAFSWANTVVRQLRTMQLQQYDAVLTSGPPHSVHYVGMDLKRRCGMKWIADFRDHFTLAPEYRRGTPIRHAINQSFERRILAQTDAVIANTSVNRDELLEQFGDEYSATVHVIYNGFDQNDLMPGNGPVPDWPSGVRNYLYFGGLRGPAIDDRFFGALAMLHQQNPEFMDSIRIRVVGDARKLGGAAEQLINAGVLTVQEPLPFNQVRETLDASDGCLLWQGTNPRYRGTIAGKFFDYFACRKPVFSVGQDDGEIARLLREHELGISVLPDSQSNVAAEFMRFDAGVRQGAFDYSKCDERLFDLFDRKSQAIQLARILNQLLKQKHD